MNGPPPRSGPPLLFLVVTFTVASVVAILIAYFGINGTLGAGIP